MSTESSTTSASIGNVNSLPSATVLAANIPQTSVKLDGTNFLLWKTLTIPTLSGLNLHGYLDGSYPAPEKTIPAGDEIEARVQPNPEYHTWWLGDQRVLGALLSLMTPDVASQMVGVKTSADVWSAVHAMYSAQNRATVRQTRFQLQTLKKRDSSAAEYYRKMKALADTMATIGSPLTDDEIIDYILAGLGPEYGSLTASLMVANKQVTLPDFYSFILTHEALLDQHQQTNDWMASANAATRPAGSGSYTPRRSTPQTPRDRRSTSPRSPNNQNSGQNGGRGGGNRNRNGASRFRPRCQICRIYGHEAWNCNNRFNEMYNGEEHRFANAADRQGYTDPDWYLDTGATDHLTSDLDRLTT